MKNHVFSLWDMDNCIREAGAERVCETASEKLDSVLAKHADEILFNATIYANHAGRKKLCRADIMLAARHLRIAAKKRI